MNKQPLVSIIMPVYNTDVYLMEALESVLNQTYKNIELIAVNDGSTDTSLEILQIYAQKDKRVKVFRIKKNQGVVYAASLGIKKASGVFIARMDSDDIMPLDRIEKQVNYLQENPDIIVVGGQVELVNKDGLFLVKKSFPKNHKDILNMAFSSMSIQQGAMMVNTQLLPKDFIWYQTELKTSEDLDFFFRTFKYGKGANLDSTCLYYRQHGQSITQAENPKEIFYQAYKVRQLARKTYGIRPTPSVLAISYLQYALVTVLPSSLIYPLYYLWRGIRPLQPSKNGYNALFKHVFAYVF